MRKFFTLFLLMFAGSTLAAIPTSTPTMSVTVNNETAAPATTMYQTITKYLLLTYCPSTFTVGPGWGSTLLPGQSANFEVQQNAGSCNLNQISANIYYKRADGEACSFRVVNNYSRGYSVCDGYPQASGSNIGCSITSKASGYSCQFDAVMGSVSHSKKSK